MQDNKKLADISLDRAKKRREDFWREQTRKRVEHAFLQRSKYRKKNFLFSYERLYIAKLHKEQVKIKEIIENLQDKARLANYFNLTYGLDRTIPYANRLIIWPQEIAKLYNNKNSRGKIIKTSKIAIRYKKPNL